MSLSNKTIATDRKVWAFLNIKGSSIEGLVKSGSTSALKKVALFSFGTYIRVVPLRFPPVCASAFSIFCFPNLDKGPRRKAHVFQDPLYESDHFYLTGTLVLII